MDAFGIDGGGAGRYAAGLLTLPDGTARGIETVARVAIRDDRPGLQRTTGTVAGSVRDALPQGASLSPSLSLPLRLALSTVRAGLGAVEQELRPREAVRVEIGFSDGTTLVASMSAASAELIRRDAEIARGILARAGREAVPQVAPDTAPDEALTSIFRYEKRNGRLRRVAADRSET